MVGNHGAAFLASKYSRRDQAHTIEQISLQSCILECDQRTPSRYGLIFDVPQGVISGCTMQMYDKTAFVGWSAESTAAVRFSQNIVRGRNPAANRPFFTLRPTRGALLVDGNQFIGDHRQPKPAGGSWLVTLDNPGATVRNNLFIIPAQAYSAVAAAPLLPAVLANARLLEANRYQTDLPADSGGFFGILYSRSSSVRNELFRGTRPGFEDTVRPGELRTRQPFEHDSRVPWSR
jgi:hypothetical protein